MKKFEKKNSKKKVVVESAELSTEDILNQMSKSFKTTNTILAEALKKAGIVKEN
jgi:hypothetical protein